MKGLKQKIAIAVIAASATVLLTGVWVNAEDFAVTPKSAKINEGETIDLKIPQTAETPIWISSDPNTANVTVSGNVTGLKAGKTTVKARAGEQTATCTVTVAAASVKLNKTTATLYHGGTATSSVKITPTVKGTSSAVEWTSSNPAVATVDSKGKVTSVSSGNAVITASANGKTAACSITVKETAIRLSESDLQLTTKGAGKAVTLTTAITGSGKTVKWSSSDKSVAAVSAGKITGKKAGTAVITAKANGVTATCNVTVTAGSGALNIASVDIIEDSVRLKTTGNDKTHTLPVAVAGKATTIKWKSSDATVVTVKNGKLTAKKAGSAVVTATANGVSDTVNVVVEAASPTIKLDKSQYTLFTKQSNSITLKATVTGESKSVTWSSSAPSVASVNSSGKVKAQAEGVTVISATANGVSAKCIVTVHKTDIVLRNTDLSLGVGGKQTLRYDIFGASQSVKWTTTNSKVATVSSKGVVTGKKVGKADIKLKANKMTVVCHVTVLAEACQHVYDTGVTTKEPSCTMTGIKKHTCANCGASYNERTAVSPHRFIDTVIPPTRESQGYTTHTCSVCDYSYSDNYVDYKDDSDKTENDDSGKDDSGNDQPGNDDPGNDDPGNDDPGNDDPGNDDPGNDDPGNDDPGNNDPIKVENAVKKENYRITIDGRVYQGEVYQDEKKEIYLAEAKATALLGSAPDRKFLIGDQPYAKLSRYAEKDQIDSYEYDAVLDASYIWIKDGDTFSDKNRIAYYGLGTPSRDEITYAEFFEILDKTGQILAPDKLEAWKAMLPEARKSTDKITRIESLMALIHFVTAMDCGYEPRNEFDQNIYMYLDPNELDAVRTEKNIFRLIKNEYPCTLGKFASDVADMCDVAAKYGHARKSMINDKTLIDYDAENQSMHYGWYLTRLEALSMASRLLDSAEPEDYHDRKYISVTDDAAVNVDAKIITEELLESVKDMPYIHVSGGDAGEGEIDISEWSGFDFCEYTEREDIRYKEFGKMAKNTSEWGFNVVKYYLNYLTLFDEKVTKVDENELKKLDYVVASAMHSKIHLNLIMNNLPGRWERINGDNYTSTGDFDLFTDPEHQKEVRRMLDMLAKRYQDVPSNALSFNLIHDAQNVNLGTGLSAEKYTVQDMAPVFEMMVDTLQQYRTDRLVLFDPNANILWPTTDRVVEKTEYIRNAVESGREHVQMLLTLCPEAYDYANMLADSDRQIDNMNYSMFCPEYPTIVYETQGRFSKYNEYGTSLVLDGDLVQGTTVTIYLSHTAGNGTFKITASSGDVGEAEVTLYSEELTGTRNYEVTMISAAYGHTEKKIQVQLDRDFKEITIDYNGDAWMWSGMDVDLPEQYAVQRWYNVTRYEVWLEAEDKDHLDESKIGLILRPKTNIRIAAYNDYGDRITIRKDTMSYFTDKILEQASAESLEENLQWYSEYVPNSIADLYLPVFSGTGLEDAMEYYEDLFPRLRKYRIGYFITGFHYNYVLSDNPISIGKYYYGGATAVPYKGKHLCVELLREFQKYTESARKF